LLAGALVLAWPGLLFAQETADFFKQSCASCHTIGGGRLTGPDLKDVTKRKDRDWLVSFILDPKAVIDSGDPYAARLLEEARGVVMPQVHGLTRERAERLLDLIEAESKLERSQFAGLKISDKPFTPAEVERGRELFLGLSRLSGGGPACVSCHSVRGSGGLGGGKLGPDLTTAYERMEGRKNLASWLLAPATPTMSPVYKKHPLKPEEVLPLVAYLEEADREGGEESPSTLVFFLLGLGGAVAGLVTLDVIWKGRFRAVRRPLVHGQQTGGEG
jgi:mono/diheme cytochrome c family protein